MKTRSAATGEDDLQAQGRRGAPIDDCLVVDFHGHLGATNAFDIPLQTADELVPIMDRIGIDMLGVSHLLSLRGDVRGNDLVAEAIRRYPSRFFGYAVVSPHQIDRIVPELDRCRLQLGLKAIKTHTHFQNHPASGPGFWRMYEYARAHRLPVLGHSFGDATEAERILRAFPDVTFIQAHMAGASPVNAVPPVLELAVRFDNLYVDLASSLAYRDDLEMLVATIGAGKVLYASDMCYQQATHQIGRVLFARLGREDKARILGANAAGILRLEERT